jgi:hypothetical protein
MWFPPVWLATGFTTPDWTKDSDQADASFAWSVSSAGDVNGDGFADVIVGAPDHDRGEVDEGGAFLFLGSPSGLPSAPDWDIEGDQAAAATGSVVAAAGDVNGDGFDDVLVGAPDYDGGFADQGRVWVHHGSVAGPDASATWTGESDRPGAAYGSAAAGAGDVNGDGYADLIIGAPLFAEGEVDEGGAWVFHGSAGGLAIAASWEAAGEQAGALFGASVACAGDVNGDGFDDVLVGAHGFDDTVEDQGRSDLYLGSAGGLAAAPAWTASTSRPSAHYGWSVAGAGDVNRDGFDDVLVGAPYWDQGDTTDEGKAVLYLGAAAALPATSAWGFELDSAFEHVGWAIASAGDINGDGFGDVVLGADNWDHPESFEGAAFVFLGSVAGLSPTAAHVLDSGQSFCDFGWSVASAGDVDGDGFDDVLVGAPRYSAGEYEEGRAYVFRGACVDPTDADSDGACADVDCDDQDPDTFPGAVEQCDGRDNACAGAVPADELDADGDGPSTCEGDCDDADPTRQSCDTGTDTGDLEPDTADTGTETVDPETDAGCTCDGAASGAGVPWLALVWSVCLLRRRIPS